MPLHKVYYLLKPLLPSKVRIALRRRLARKLKGMFQHAWPIDERAGKKPAGWGDGRRGNSLRSCLPMMWRAKPDWAGVRA